MSCITCGSRATCVCKQCRITSYCSGSCARQDWDAIHYALCGGKTDKRERNEGPDRHPLCEEGEDPFTLEQLSSIPTTHLIVLDGHCYHLPSLYNWIINEGHDTDPLTNDAFSAMDIERLRETGRERFALRIDVIHIGGPPVIVETSTLITVQALFKLLVGRGDLGMLQLLKALTGQSFSFPDTEPRLNDIDMITQQPNTQLTDITGGANTLRVFYLRILTPPVVAARLPRIIAYATERGYPVDDLRASLNRVRAALDENERAQIRRNQMREIRAERHGDEVDIPEGAWQFNLQLNTSSGYDYGQIPVYVMPNEPLSVVVGRAREYVQGVIDVPANIRRFIFAGRAYFPDTTAEDIPGFQAGVTLYATI